MMNRQQSVQGLEKQTTDLRCNIEDVDILTQRVRETLVAQQKEEAAKQTVAKGWPKEFSDAERHGLINWFLHSKGWSGKPVHDHTCTDGTNLHPPPAYTGQMSGRSAPLRILSTSGTSGTTSATQQSSGASAPTQCTMETSHKLAMWREM